MNPIGEIVFVMSADDKKAFTAYLTRRNKRLKVQNINFFKLFETDDTDTLKKKFGSGKNNDAYHALRKRVYDALVEFMANRAFEVDTSDEHEVLKLLVVSRVFLEYKLYKTAFKCLAKAEKKALPLEQFSLLNEIYHTQIQFAHLPGRPALEETIRRFNANRQMLHAEQQLNIGYALLRRELAEIYHNGKVVNLRALIGETIETLGVSLNEILSYKSLYQILFIANEFASINSDFSSIEPFIERSLAFTEKKEANRHLYYHIYVLYFIANSYLRNRRFDKALSYLDQMHDQMQLKQQKYYARFYHRWALLRALTLNYSGKAEEAVQVVQQALSKHRKGDTTDINDLWLCICIIYVQKSDKTAFKYIRLFGHSDSWYEKRMGMDWAIKKALVEIILHAEFDNTELALQRIKAFRKRYSKYLTEVKEGRVLNYVQLVEHYLLKPEAQTPEIVMERLGTGTDDALGSDIFVLRFTGWLIAKVSKKPVYETILSLTQGN